MPARRRTSVIGGRRAPMPPVLGWAAVQNESPPRRLILFLIIFAWTPPHFGRSRCTDPRTPAPSRPMLPVTHGPRYTR